MRTRITVGIVSLLALCTLGGCGTAVQVDELGNVVGTRPVLGENRFEPVSVVTVENGHWTQVADEILHTSTEVLDDGTRVERKEVSTPVEWQPAKKVIIRR